MLELVFVRTLVAAVVITIAVVTVVALVVLDEAAGRKSGAG